MERQADFLEYFNSQPHKEADENCWLSINTVNISTHSLTRRLTTQNYYRRNQMSISTHSLTRRLTASEDTS